MPARKSRTRFCAPKPTATPTIPALATIGARLMSSSPRIVTKAIPKTMMDVTLRSSDPTVSARCRRRSSSTVGSPKAPSSTVRPERNNPPEFPLEARRVVRTMNRCSSDRMRKAATRISTIFSGVPTKTSAPPARY